MAKITTITNPLTGQPAQVDQLDHTAQQIDDGLNIARGVSNHNLLDNWYFGNPINQRGQTSYTGSGYGIDRWEANELVITDDGVIVKPNSYFNQKFTFDTTNKTFTMSVLTADNILSAYTVKTGIDAFYYNGVVNGIRMELYSNPNGTSYFMAYPTESSKIFNAAKLELGSQQTLAHQDENGNWVLNEIPDYGEQLARCQRYYQVFDCTNAYSVIAFGQATEANVFRGLIPTLAAMRTIPAIVFNGSNKSLVLYGNSSAVGASSATYSVIQADINGVGFLMTVSSLTKNETYVLQAYGCKLELSADL